MTPSGEADTSTRGGCTMLSVVACAGSVCVFAGVFGVVDGCVVACFMGAIVVVVN